MEAPDAVAIFAPLGRDAALLAAALTKADVSALVIDSFPALLQAARSADVGALLTTAEAFSKDSLADLGSALAEQPHWSDIPVMVLVPGGGESRVIGSMETALDILPNLTMLERPIRPATLLSVLKVAQKSRLRQREVKRIMEEREQTAASMVQSEKLAAVGRLASSISHEINNPLEAITNLLYLLRGEKNLSKAGREYLETAERELARVSQITSQTLRFHRQSTAATTVEPQALLEEVIDLYKGRLANSNIQISRAFAPNVTVTCLEGDIRQVLRNLVGNAFDVMRNGGRLLLKTRNLTWWATGQRGVMITVLDDGPGMPEAVRRRIFDAFYSTKGIQGTGLGLWLSKRIVQNHRGHLGVRSCTGVKHGTMFHLWLPCELAESANKGWHAETV